MGIPTRQRGHLPKRGQGMAGGADDAALPTSPDKAFRTGNPERPSPWRCSRTEGTAHIRADRAASAQGRMGAAGRRCKVWAIEIRAEDAGPARALPLQLLASLQEPHVFLVRRHRGRRTDAGPVMADEFDR